MYGRNKKEKAMANYTYLIVGGGMTGNAAVKGVRKIDKQGSIGVFSEESHPPYNRPPLTKDLWKGKSLEMVWLKDAARSATLHLGRAVRAIDAVKKNVIDDQGEIHHYEKIAFSHGRRSPADGA
jgi:3-phenylpropionate/trans-cinnamate dioxygenase ferredoxin reductase component